MRLDKLLRRFRYWRTREQRAASLQEEIEFHIDALTRELVAQGLSPQEAASRARRQFGNLGQQTEQSQEVWISRWVTDAAYDLRYAVRGLIRQPGFTLFALVILALGIGLSSTVFAVLNTLVIRSLPVREAESLVWIANSGQEGLSGETIQVGHIIDLRRHAKTLTSIGGYMAFYRTGDTLLGDKTKLERITTVPVSCDFLPTLGVSLWRGRNFLPGECQFQAAGTVILSHGFWKRRFAGREDLIGNRLQIDGRQVLVIGVLPEEFEFGALFAPGVRVDLLTAFPMTPETSRWGNTMAVVGRLQPGSSVGAAQAELTSLAKAFEKIADRNELKPFVQSLPARIGGSTQRALWIVVSSVLLVMCIVCANLAGLQMARAATRQKEFAIRAAIGAGRLRLIRQVLVESLLLSLLGCSMGLVVAAVGITAISRLDSVKIPMLSQVRMDSSTVLFAMFVATASAVLFGILPALQIAPVKASSGRQQTWARNLIVVGEVAFACVLLVCAGLLGRSMLKLLDVHLGFAPDHAFSLRIKPQLNTVAEDAEILRRARETVGVEAAALTDSMPFGTNRSWGVGDAAKPLRPEFFESSIVRVVSDGFFRSMRISVMEGRDFSPRDVAESEPVIVINQAIANRFWPGQSALGKLVIVTGPKPHRVIGVVENLRHVSRGQPAGFEFYLSMQQIRDRNGLELVVRSSMEFGAVRAALERAIVPVEPSASAREVIEVQSMVNRASSPRQVLLVCLAGFAVFALLLASLGIYALIAYTVEQRSREMGIRLALGAQALSLKWNVIQRTLLLVLTGIALGLMGALPVTYAMKGLLFEVEPLDLLSFLLTGLAFVLVALLAGYLPSRRISKIDPLATIRNEG